MSLHSLFIEGKNKPCLLATFKKHDLHKKLFQRLEILAVASGDYTLTPLRLILHL